MQPLERDHILAAYEERKKFNICFNFCSAVLILHALVPLVTGRPKTTL